MTASDSRYLPGFHGAQHPRVFERSHKYFHDAKAVGIPPHLAFRLGLTLASLVPHNTEELDWLATKDRRTERFCFTLRSMLQALGSFMSSACFFQGTFRNRALNGLLDEIDDICGGNPEAWVRAEGRSQDLMELAVRMKRITDVLQVLFTRRIAGDEVPASVLRQLAALLGADEIAANPGVGDLQRAPPPGSLVAASPHVTTGPPTRHVVAPMPLVEAA